MQKQRVSIDDDYQNYDGDDGADADDDDDGYPMTMASEICGNNTK